MPRFSYVMRPAKHVERLMIVEALRRLNAITPLRRYAYVGLGALEFIDFDLVHRSLGISRMVSIEDDEEWTERYNFNMPFRGIDLLIGRASQHLAGLDWDGPRIVWLDYEGQLIEEFVRDAETVARVLHQGSVLIVTVAAGATYGHRLATLQKNLVAERIPLDLAEEAMDGPWGFAAAQRQILTAALQSVMAARVDGARLQQLFNFRYQDNARMQTVGWLVMSDALEQAVGGCHFDQLSFLRDGDDANELRVPVLTAREVRYLNKKLPLGPRAKLRERWLDAGAQADYADIYRYYPSYLQ